MKSKQSYAVVQQMQVLVSILIVPLLIVPFQDLLQEQMEALLELLLYYEKCQL
jgi:hypothetical protein